jgi:hypothetical protein
MQAYSDPRRADDPYALPDLEVFYANDVQDHETGEFRPAGWYWWACFPGCLPDGEAEGPFDSEEEALSEARQWLNDCSDDTEL